MPPLVKEPDELEFGFAFNLNKQQAALHYYPSPWTPGNRNIQRPIWDGGASAYLAKHGVAIVEAEGYFGLIAGGTDYPGGPSFPEGLKYSTRTYGGGNITWHFLRDLGPSHGLYYRVENENSIAFSQISPVEVGLQRRGDEKSPVWFRLGLVPVSLIYESRGFQGDLGSGMQLLGSGLHASSIYNVKNANGLKLIGDIETILAWTGTSHQNFMGYTSPDHGVVRSISPFLRVKAQASLPVNDELDITASTALSVLHYKSTTEPQTALENRIRLGVQYTPQPQPIIIPSDQ